MTLVYRYTQKDLLHGEAYHYHYTPYEGAALLPAYRDDRTRALARLSGPGGAAAPAASEPAPGGAGRPFAGVFERPVDTLRELAAAAAWVAGGGDPENAGLVAFADALLRKFEVSKRLRSHYAVGLKLERRDAAPVDAYCHLAYLLSRRSSAADLLWRLNGLLKLGDLVISTDGAQLSPAAAAAMAEALRQELEMVSRLAGDKGVPLA
jgi:hypothetical protein